MILFVIIFIIMVSSSSFGKIPHTYHKNTVNIEISVTNYSNELDHSVTLHIENQGPYEIYFDHSYRIEKYQGGIWYELPFISNLALAGGQIILPSKRTSEEPIDLRIFRENFVKGQTYRVVKKFETIAQEKITLAAPFKIDDDYEKAQKALKLYHVIHDYVGRKTDIAGYAGAFIGNDHVVHVGLVGKDNEYQNVFRDMAKDTPIAFYHATYPLDTLTRCMNQFRKNVDASKQLKLGIVNIGINERKNKIEVGVNEMTPNLLSEIRSLFEIEPDAIMFYESDFKI